MAPAKELALQEPKDTTAEDVSALKVPAQEWHKPVLTIIPASSAENGPGALPDSGGFDFS